MFQNDVLCCQASADVFIESDIRLLILIEERLFVVYNNRVRNVSL